MRRLTTLVLIVLVAFSTATAAAQTFGGLALAPGFPTDPASLNGVAGGPLDARMLGNTPTGPCTGQIAQTPDHTLTLQGNFNYLAVGVVSQVDTTLVIEAPNGMLLCSDDVLGLNPAIEGSWPAGTYNVYVGTFGGNAEHVFFATEVPQNAMAIGQSTQPAQAHAAYPAYAGQPTGGGGYQAEPYQGYGVDQAMGNSFSTGGMCYTSADCGVGTCVGGSCMTNWSGMMHDTTMNIIDNMP